MQLDLLLLLNEILFINFEVLKRTGNIKKRGEECVSFHSIGLCILGYYPLPKSILEDQEDLRLAAEIRSESAAHSGSRLRRLCWCPRRLLQMALQWLCLQSLMLPVTLLQS